MIRLNIKASRPLVSSSIFGKLSRAYRSGCRDIGFRECGFHDAVCWFLQEPLEHKASQRAIEILTENGVLVGEYPWWKTTGAGVILWLTREYDDAELENCDYLRVEGARCRNTIGRTSEGFCMAPVSTLKLRKVDTLLGDFPAFLVTDRVKRAIENAGFVGTVIWPVVPMRSVQGKRVKDPLGWQKIGDPWWEIRGEMTLPRLSPSVTLVYPDPARGPFSERQIVGVREGAFRGGELHYIRSEIDRLPPFDFAMTWEQFMKPPFNERLVVSQRVYQLFKQHHFRARWAPVRLDG